MAKKLQLGYREIEQRLADSFSNVSLRSQETLSIIKQFPYVNGGLFSKRIQIPEKTLAELYDPDKMPPDLREAHARLDDIVESCYPGYPFASDEARLECLFKMYEKMISAK